VNYLYNGANNLVNKTDILGGQNSGVNYLVDPNGQLPQLLTEYPSAGSATY
jgi:hypothetical protein